MIMVTDEQELKRRLLSYVVRYMDENVVCMAGDALTGLLTGVDEEVAGELLAPIFASSDCWPEEMAKMVLGIDSDEDIGFSDLLSKFEERERGNPVTPPNWAEEGF